MKGASDHATVVVIDDDYAIRLSCSQALSKIGYDVEAFEDGTRGLKGVSQIKPDLVLVDLKMPGISGLEVIPRILEIDPASVIVVITGYATISTAVDAMKAGAYDFLPKPFKPDELRMIVNRGLERRRLVIESQRAEMERELMKRRFITFVSHQLKTPLVAIHQYLDVMKHLDDRPENRKRQGEWLERCLRRTEELQSIIQDWLTLATVERGVLGRRREPVDLQPLIARVFKSYEEMARKKNVTLSSKVLELEAVVMGDPNCLAVLFDNLIVNAIKYNKPDGLVTVSAEHRDGNLVVAVSDTGTGIPEKYRGMLFEEFFRIPDRSSNDTTGTGLGLPICRHIVEELGGSIDVVSEVDVGSVFSVRLPASTLVTGESQGEEYSDIAQEDGLDH